MIVRNCHTHVFNLDFIPPHFAQAFAPKWAAKIVGPLLFNHTMEKGISKVLSVFGAGPKRIAVLFDIGSQKTQLDVFDILKKNYPEDTVFVFLPMNMDHCGLGTPFINAEGQVSDLVLKFNNDLGRTIHVFIPVDPREGSAEDNLAFVKKYYNSKCTGIKIYPSLGFYPNDERLRLVYQFASDNQIPITTHCNKDGGFYYSPNKADMTVLMPPINNYNNAEPNSPTKIFQRKLLNDLNSPKWKFGAKGFFNNFIHPINYYDVLKDFPKLKINFAHFGGYEEVIAMGKMVTIDLSVVDFYHNGQFSAWINYLCREFENAYTDISFTLVKKEALTYINDWAFNRSGANVIVPSSLQIATNQTYLLKDKILYGTDFFVIDKELGSDDNELLGYAEAAFRPNFSLIADTNPYKFLM